MIRTSTLAALTVLAANSAASAADWTGAYFGLFGSDNRGTITTTDLNSVVAPPFQIADIDTSGFSAGVLSGYNWQRGNVVFGLEVDLQLGGDSGSSTVDTVFLDETLTWKTDQLATLRGRVGFARNNVLYYASAGLSAAKATFGYLNYDDTLTILQNDERGTQSLTGTVLGLGVEMAVSEKATLRLEYLHHEFESVVREVTPGFAPVDYQPTSNSVRAALTWKF